MAKPVSILIAGIVDVRLIVLKKCAKIQYYKCKRTIYLYTWLISFRWPAGKANADSSAGFTQRYS